MPNHVKNILKADKLCILPVFSKSEDELCNMYFDFNRIIPMPESLKLDHGSITELSIEVALRKLAESRWDFNKKNYARMNGIEYRRKQLSTNKSDQELAELGLKYISNKILYGATTWYDWRIDNWGTKWNSYDNEKIDNDTISFKTAWNAPHRVIEKLASTYSGLTIEHWWADEDMGCNTGFRLYKGGSPAKVCEYESCSNRAYENYIHCWGPSNCLAKDSQGNFYTKDCEVCEGCS